MWFCIEVRFLHGRYHGRGDWPPTSLRLFQAITGGALSGRWAVEDRPSTEAALRWLEGLGAPARVMGPAGRALRPYRLAVPNNQADRHIPALRGGARLDDLLRQDKELKHVQPVAIDRHPLVYAWEVGAEQKTQAEAARTVVRRLVALGTGLDHAVADVRLCAETSTAAGMIEYDIREAPCAGTLDSLTSRHRAELERLAGGGLRENLPPVRSDVSSKGRSRAEALLFLLRTPADAESERSLPVVPEASAVLAYAIRRELARELREQLTRFSTAWPPRTPPFSTEDVERLVLGRGARPADKERRVSVLPLPSIGHEHADGLVRRVLIVIPTACPMAPEVARRALSNAEIVLESSEAKPNTRLGLVPVEQDDRREQTMLRHYVGEARVWRTVSPIVLPGAASKIQTVTDPAERAAIEAQRRCREEALVHRAINDAGIHAATIRAVRLRREPFGPHQPRADARWQLPRNSEGRHWLGGKPRVHAEIVFAAKRPGPLALGDGRYLGLGLMQPVRDASRGVVVFGLASEPRISAADRGALLGAVRRALMSLSRQSDGGVPRLFSGHEADGAPAQSGRHEHVFLSGADLNEDGYIDSLIVSAPWRCDHPVRHVHADAALFDRVVSSLELVRAGRLGIVSLVMHPAGAEDCRVVGPARMWESHAHYSPTRPMRRGDDPLDVLRRDVAAECRRRGLPQPDVEVLNHIIEMDGRIAACLVLHFAVGVAGPLMLGRDSHQGGGLFLARVDG
jgi:CRISPR-associated protein Csb2